MANLLACMLCLVGGGLVFWLRNQAAINDTFFDNSLYGVSIILFAISVYFAVRVMQRK